MATAKTQAAFIEPMLLLRSESLPRVRDWIFELRLDSYRSLAIKAGGKVQFCSRNDSDFSGQYPLALMSFAAMPDDTVIADLIPDALCGGGDGGLIRDVEPAGAGIA